MNSFITPIFSGGVGRSGTTIVGRILRKHSSVFAGSPFEIKFITEAYGLIDLVFGLRKFLPTQISKKGFLLSRINSGEDIDARFNKFQKRIYEDWWIRTNRLGMESGLHRALTKNQMKNLLEELEGGLESPKVAARNFIQGYITNHHKWRGEPYWMDTTPANMMYANFIYRIFPEAKFLEMRRNALDNISSVLKETWGPNDPAKAIRWWKDRISLADQAKAEVPASQYLTLMLENLVRDNREISYQKMLSLIGIQDERDMRSYFESEVTSERAHFGRWRTDSKEPENFRILFETLQGNFE